MKIPMSRPDIGEFEIAKVNEVLSTATLSLGPMLVEFEQRVAEFLGAKHAVGVSSGTAGLHLAMKAAGIGPGSEVITSPFSFVASANCIIYQGGRPVFVDIDPTTMNLDTSLIEERITERTKALLPVHVFGQPCEMDKILNLAQRYGLRVVEDACEAFGTEFEGRRVGAMGDSGVFGFYPNKQVTTGEGGMVVTNDDQQAELFRSLRNQGRNDDDQFLRHDRLGYNYRLDELSCALGVAQLERIDELLWKREQVAAHYTECLEGLEGVRLPSGAERGKVSWFVYVIRLAPGIDREALMGRLAEDGVPSRPYFPAIHTTPTMMEMFGYQAGDFPVTEAVSRSTLALPFHGNMPEDHVEFVCEALRKALMAQVAEV